MDRITDRPDMTSAVDRGRKASTQINKQNILFRYVAKLLSSRQCVEGFLVTLKTLSRAILKMHISNLQDT